MESDYIEMLKKNINHCDAVACSARYIQDGIEQEYRNFGNHIYSGNQQIKDAYLDKKDLYRAFRSPWGKIYKNNTINGLKFDECLEMGEDIVFNLYFLQRTNAVRTISYCGYNVRRRLDSITHQAALQYAASGEHNNSKYYEIKTIAQKNWGFSNEFLFSEKKRANPSRYFNQVMNLVLPGTPYNREQVKEKIKQIHADQAFVQSILAQEYRNLSLVGKIAKFNIQLNMPGITEIMFWGISKIHYIFIKSVWLKKILHSK